MWLGVHRKVTSALCDLLHPTNVQLTVVAGNGQKDIRTFRSGLPGMFEFNWSSLLLFGWMLLCRLQHLLCSCVAYWRVTYRGVAPITSLYSWQLQHSTAVNMLFTGATELRNLHGIVMAYRIWRGSCWRESCQSLDSHSNVSGGTSTQFGLQLRNGGPAEWSKSTSTAIGKCGGLWSVGTATGELYQQNHYKDKVAAKCWQSTWSPSGLLWSTLK